MKNFGKTTDIRDIITVGYEADNAVLYSTSQSLTNDQKIQARANIGAGTSNFDGDYKTLANKPTIPTKTSQLDNDSNFATTSQVEAKYKKPPGGIPKTDLATAVQNSLTAADNAVKYTNQSLTDAQKEQARKNIGAGTSSFSGNYKDLADKPDIPDAVSIVQSIGESTSSVMSQKATTNAVNGRLSKTDNTNIEVLGTKKATTTLGGNQLYAPNGIIFGGTAAAAGLVTRGICGVSTPSDGGACSKENLYINYDGNNDFNAGRQVVLNAGTVGNHLGSNMYQYTVPRGEIVKNWVEAKGYATSVKVNGNTIASSGGVVDIGTVVTDVSGKQDKITSSNKLSASLVSGLATVATSGSYNDLLNKPSFADIPDRGEAFLTWGGKNFASSYSPIDAAMVPALGANRLAFVPAAGIKVEYSRDNGTNWSDYELNDSQKTAIFSGPQVSTTAVIGKPGSKNPSTNKYDNASVNNRLRITILTNFASVYTQLNKFVIYCSTSGSGGCKCTIDGRTKANYDANSSTWTTFADGVTISGWSGFNVINTPSITTYGNTSNQYVELRFTFYCTSAGSMATYGGLQISNIYGFGGVGWTTPSTMAKWGQVYTYDASQNVTFPAAVKASTLYEDGTSLANKYLGKTAKAADSDKLDGNDSTYYLNYNNLNNKPTFSFSNGVLTITT